MEPRRGRGSLKDTGSGAKWLSVIVNQPSKTKGTRPFWGGSLIIMGSEPAVVAERPLRPTRLSYELEEVGAAEPLPPANTTAQVRLAALATNERRPPVLPGVLP